jgi:hypothetical protein
MRKQWWLLLGLTLAGIAGGAGAAIPESAVVASCADDIHVVLLGQQNFAVVEGADALTTQSPQSLAAKPLTLVGALASVKRVSQYLGTHPALLVDLQEPGRARVLLGTDAGLAEQVLEYSVAFGVARAVMCAPGAAFPAVQQAVAELPQVSDWTYLRYIDRQMALSCRPADRPAAPVSYLVRALSSEPANSKLQVWDVTRDFYSDGRIELEKFEDRQSDVRYYPAERSDPSGSADLRPEPAEFLLVKAPSLDGLGQGRYAAQFFDGTRTQQLLCEPLQAFISNIEKPLALARSLR